MTVHISPAGHMSPTQSTGLQGVPQENREQGWQQASPAGPNAAPQPLSEERVVVISSDDSDAENQVSGPEVRPRTSSCPQSSSQGSQPQRGTLTLALGLGNCPARQ